MKFKTQHLLYVALAALALSCIAIVPDAHQGISLALHMPSFGPEGLLIGMTTLAADKNRIFEIDGYNDLPVIASDIIYEGAAVGDNGTNMHRPLVNGDTFKGFAETTVDNASGAAGAKNVRVRSRGRVQIPITSFDSGDVDKPVYMTDDDTFSLTQSTNSYVGRAVRFIATGTTMLAFDADKPPSGRLDEVLDSGGGTASGTIAAISATFVQAEVRNAIASLAAKVNALLRQTSN